MFKKISFKTLYTILRAIIKKPYAIITEKELEYWRMKLAYLVLINISIDILFFSTPLKENKKNIDYIYNHFNKNLSVLFFTSKSQYDIADIIKRTHGYRLPLLVKSDRKIMVPFYLILAIIHSCFNY